MRPTVSAGARRKGLRHRKPCRKWPSIRASGEPDPWGIRGRIGGFPSYADLVAANHATRAPRFVSVGTAKQVASGSTTSPL
jgi:hypothetical protein